MLLPKESWLKVHEVHKIWKIRNKKIIHKPTNQEQSMKHNRTCATLQETFNEIKLIGKEIKICQIDHTITTHGDTNALSINAHDQNKGANCPTRNLAKQSNLNPPQL